MLFGTDNSKGIRLNGIELEVVTIGENGITEADILVHDAENTNNTLHYMLTKMKLPEFPVAMGVIRSVRTTTYDEALHSQREHEMANSKFNSLDDLFTSGNTFEVS